MYVVHSPSQTNIGHWCHTSGYQGYHCHTHICLLYYACILDGRTSHPDWSWLTYPMQTDIYIYIYMQWKTIYVGSRYAERLFTSLLGKHHSCPTAYYIATTLTFDNGSPNSSCNCDCGALLVDTEPFPGAKGGTLKWRFCPISLSTTWLPWKEKWCQTFLFLFIQQQCLTAAWSRIYWLQKGYTCENDRVLVVEAVTAIQFGIAWAQNCAYGAFSAIAERYAQIIYSSWRPSSIYRCSHLITKLHNIDTTLC